MPSTVDLFVRKLVPVVRPSRSPAAQSALSRCSLVKFKRNRPRPPGSRRGRTRTCPIAWPRTVFVSAPSGRASFRLEDWADPHRWRLLPPSLADESPAAALQHGRSTAATWRAAVGRSRLARTAGHSWAIDRSSWSRRICWELHGLGLEFWVAAIDMSGGRQHSFGF